MEKFIKIKGIGCSVGHSKYRHGYDNSEAIP